MDEAAEALASQTLLSTGVTLPEGFLCDDTALVYNKTGELVDERDAVEFFKEDEAEVDDTCCNSYAEFALKHYNIQHNTDYKVLRKKDFYMSTFCYSNTVENHIGFHAARPGCAANFFCSKLEKEHHYNEKEAKLVVTSCIIVDGSYKCESCHSHATGSRRMENEMDDVTTSVVSVVPPASEYRHLLADGVNLSEKALLRLRFTLLALPHYNSEKGTDYRLVDVLPFTFGIGESVVAHCNFIAKQKGDSKNKLFFAEIESILKIGWVVRYCCIVQGQTKDDTKAGCYICPPRLGERVIHPMRGYHFGVYPVISLTGSQLRNSACMREPLDQAPARTNFFHKD